MGRTTAAHPRVRRAASLVVLAVIASGCESEVKPTRAVVEVRSDFREDLAFVRVEISDATGTRHSEPRVFPVQDEQDKDFLLSFAVAPRADGEAEPFVVLATGLDAQQEHVVEGRQMGNFLPHQFARLVVRLDRACAGVFCDATTTCSAERVAGTDEPCVGLDQGNTFPATAVDGGRIDAGQAQDGGHRDARNTADGDLNFNAVESGLGVGPQSEGGQVGLNDGNLESPPSMEVNECEVDNGGCPADATCTDTVGSRVCTCNAGFEDVNGDGSKCMDKCALAGCDANANCKIVGIEAVCECVASYIGDGKTCTFDASCSQLQCDLNATCDVTGASRACKCREGFSGSGTTCVNVDECKNTPSICGANSTCTDTPGAYSCACVAGYRDTGNGCENIDECSPSPCQHGGSCSDGIGSYTCDCTGTGFTGTQCQTNVDDCAPNPCQNGGACSDGTNGYTCNCPAGFSGATCELEICGDTVIRSRADVDANRLCVEIQGKLDIPAVGLADISADDFPYLTKVTGNVQIQGTQSGTGTFLQSVTLSKLQEIGGQLAIVSVGATGPLQELHLPALVTVGSLSLTEAGIVVLDLPALTTINGAAFIYGVTKLCTLNVRRVTRVTGALQITNAYKISAQQFAPLRSAAQSKTEANVGCCLQLSTDKVSCDLFGESQRNTYCNGC